MKPTDEQAGIIDAAAAGKNTVIQAGAGTGKTSTLKMVARKLNNRSAIYIAYNKSIATEAAASFPDTVSCRTSHSLAMRAIGHKYAHRLRGPRELPERRVQVLGTPWIELSDTVKIPPRQAARIALETVMRYCYSADDEIDVTHMPKQNGVEGSDHWELAKRVVPYAKRAWADLCSRDGLLKLQHDHYLKMWALTRPELPAEVVMLDEAQDSNPLVAQLVQSQTHAQQIAVGDSNQSLYQWRGAVDALGDWPADEVHYLTQSWRFGPVIADEANRWLAQIDTPLRLTGNPQISSELVTLGAPKAILCRTNGEAMNQVMTLLSAGVRVALAGGGSDIAALARAAQELKSGRRTSHPELYVFATWGALQDYVDNDHGGRDLKPFVDLIDTHGPETVLEAVNALVDEKACATYVSTSHRSKGREWDSVKIANDFGESPDGEISKVDGMLAYVAVTRARRQLDRGGLAWIDKYSEPAKPAAPVQAPVAPPIAS
ncbi:DNA helicase [Mycolicibacterium llatzerense]|nr:DNA helicase [Mycolicibacterium llatzerense]